MNLKLYVHIYLKKHESQIICSLKICECYLKLLLYDLIIIKRLTDVYIKHFQLEKLIVWYCFTSFNLF